MTRRDAALAILNGLGLPLDADDDTVDAAVYAAYPWGERKYHPYKVWLDAVKAWKATRGKLRAIGGTRGAA